MISSYDSGPAARLVAPLTRVCVGKGWVVHGLALEFGDGSRAGAFLENDGTRMDLKDDAGLTRREGVMREVPTGERVVAVRGHASTMGYLCGSLTLMLSSGKEIACIGENANVFGAAFEYVVPEGDELADITFADGNCTGVVLRSQVAELDKTEQN